MNINPLSECKILIHQIIDTIDHKKDALCQRKQKDFTEKLLLHYTFKINPGFTFSTHLPAA